MKFKAFKIENYRGINHAEISLNGGPGSIYTLVGLNESGKTTILEALNSFRHDVDGIHAMAQKALSSTPIEALVPKNKKDNFNDTISISAKVQIRPKDIKKIADECKSEFGFQLDIEKFPHEFWVSRKHYFENSEHTKSATAWELHPLVKKRGGRKFVRVSATNKEWQEIVKKLGYLFPRIIYFPTFLFDFPERIQVSDGECDVEGNEYFKRMIEDALASLDDPLDLQTHIVDRVLKKDPETMFGAWMAMWVQSDERERVVAALTRLSNKVSQEIFGRWKDVLGSDIGNKELVIEPIIDSKDNKKRVVYLSFKVKDGYSSFKVAERSLGFRWFFCFLLFTRFFRGNKRGESVFLFDEPASNLHSMAQTKLLDSLKVIADNKNDIVYSTHSHHLINPLWLETTYIVANGEPTDESKVVDAEFGVEDTDIKAIPYRHFVGQNAEKSHYFQPILDRLQVAPSMLEATRRGVITEGKSDFYILNWYKKYHNPSLDLDFVPVGGVTNGGSIMSLYLGLCVDFLFLLDGDKEGDEAKSRYIRDLPVSTKQLVQLPEILGKQVKVIEDVVGLEIRNAIAEKYSVRKVSKKHIQRAFSEALSGKNDLPFDSVTIAFLESLCTELERRLSSAENGV